jgi:hypothetical protein
MYFIVNITKPPREVTISDLNFTLGPNKAIDLEKVRKRSEIEDSVNLKAAIRQRMIQVRHPSKPPTEAPVEPTAAPSSMGESDIARIRETVREEFQAQISQMGKNQGVTPELGEILSKLTLMLEKGASLGNGGGSKAEVESKVDEDDGVDEATMIMMSEKNVRDRTKNTEANVQSEEQKVSGNISSKAKRFRDLLG